MVPACTLSVIGAPPLGGREATEDQFEVRELGDIIPEHYPVVPCKFAYVADVSSAAGHNVLWHFAIGHVNVIAHIGSNKSFELNAMVPYNLG